MSDRNQTFFISLLDNQDSVPSVSMVVQQNTMCALYQLYKYSPGHL